MILAALFIVLVLMFFLPFVPGIIELRQKKDAAPLYINMEWTRNPRYFGVSFKTKLRRALENIGDVPGRYDLKISQRETLDIVEDGKTPPGVVQRNIFVVKNALYSGPGVTFEKEVYVRDAAHIGERNHLHALAADADVHIQKGTHFLRWLDAEGSIRIEEGCDLGLCATSGKDILLGPGCVFTRLYAPTVMTHGLLRFDEQGDDALLPLPPESMLERGLCEVPAESRTFSHIIASKSLLVHDRAVIQGHVKSHEGIVTGEAVTIVGNVFAEEDVVLGPRTRVLGSVFSQGHIIAREGVTIGAKGKIKSLIGKKGVTLESGVKIYGYVTTEEKGTVI